MKAVRPVAGRLGLRSSNARRGKPPRKRNATAQAVGENLGGFCRNEDAAKDKNLAKRAELPDALIIYRE